MRYNNYKLIKNQKAQKMKLKYKISISILAIILIISLLVIAISYFRVDRTAQRAAERSFIIKGEKYSGRS